ncbi:MULTISPECIES: GNAT family N-acetyltransferase [Halocynthiibacter]|uniref:GNAT family N-acetyltransferase n=1 Tax=Halocynthiibacter halioticoli TaxID=2986804 RepID=A0AAE3LRZ1_9RHOB|nr:MULTISPECIES: GNAT family protein [Halocynthiibacter]MCV6826002.1 GNAT family N-acetyltransferase [Halocynthiibacter halioticoli]MCW4059003.1 GNAT family N-acetyltransferase [Halocynthiibacter sp. SDUM655004]
MGGNTEPDRSRGLVIERVGSVMFGADRIVGEWVAERIPTFVHTPESKALGVIKGDKLVAGVVYERFNGVHMEVSIAADTGSPWADRETLRTLFHYPFIQLGCAVISVIVPASNLQSLNLATKLGFHPEAYIKFAAHDGSALVVLKMFRETCKWIDYDGQKGR